MSIGNLTETILELKRYKQKTIARKYKAKRRSLQEHCKKINDRLE